MINTLISPAGGFRTASSKSTSFSISKLVVLALGASLSATAVADVVMEEILVTASKTGATNLMKTAVTANVVTGDQLELREIRDAYDLRNQVPGLQVDWGNAAPKVTIRGVGSSTLFGITAENGVAVYANDIFFQRSQGVSAAFFDMESVDVLKGPQGTSFGRNAMGGSINYISQRPVEGTEAEVSIGGGSFGKQEVHGIFNYGTDAVGVRVGAKYKDEDGFTKNLVTGSDVDGIEQTILKAALSFAPTDNFEGVFRVDYLDDHNSKVTYVKGAEPFFVPQVFIPGTNSSFDEGENYEVSQNRDPFQDLESTVTSLHLDWALGELQLRSITGFYSLEEDYIIDGDYSDTAYLDIPYRTMDSDQFSQEFVLSGSAGAMEWVTGVYYLSEDTETSFGVDLQLFGQFIAFDDEQKTTAMAVFAQGAWSLNESTRLIAGVRYSEDEKEYTTNQRLLAPAFAPICQSSAKEIWDDLTWDLTLARDLSDDTFAYAKVATGFKSGGYNTAACADPFEPEELTSYEIGYKGTFWDGTLNLESSAFYYDYTDLQLSRVAGVPPTSLVINASDSEVYGIDFQLRALLTNSTSIDFGLSWVPIAEYDNFVSIDSLDARNALFGGADNPSPVDVSGNRLNRTAEYSGTLGLNYNAELSGGWSTDARLELYFTDDLSYSEFDRPSAYNASIEAFLPSPLENDINVQEGYKMINAYVSLNYGEDWTIRLYGKNLTDEYYYTHVTENSIHGGAQGSLGRPREGGIQLTYRFSDK